ncbi:EamA family transporter [Stella sp.]|uniref:EamA family transporter n=1 Tax=Stella sp. TaxID=2912054 RepID=UPI0035AF4564
MDLWVPITVAAALLQCLRTAQQKVLKGRLSTNGVNYARYIYGAPIAAAAFFAYLGLSGVAMPATGGRFLFFCLLGGVAQIVATSFLILSFTMRNFAAGTTYSKTETVQTALLATIFLAEPLTLGGWVAIVIGLAGVLTLSVPAGASGWRQALLGVTDRAALYGLASGGLFGVSAIGIRGASLSLGDADFVVRSLMTLASVTALQTVLMTAYLQAVERGEVMRVIRAWRHAAPVGVMSVLGSAGWFTAMTLQNVAYVRALGQVELVFTVLVSRFGFREPPTWRELVGILLVAVGVVALLLLH